MPELTAVLEHNMCVSVASNVKEFLAHSALVKIVRESVPCIYL
jgi:hypothetical protein